MPLSIEDLLDVEYEKENFRLRRRRLKDLSLLESLPHDSSLRISGRSEADFWQRLNQKPCFRRYVPGTLSSKKTIFYIPNHAVLYETAATDNFCRYLATQQACQVIALYPGLAPEHSHADIIKELKTMIDTFVRVGQKFGVDADNIELVGHGIGATQALLLVGCTLMTYKFSQLRLISPIVDFRVDENSVASRYSDHDIDKRYLKWLRTVYFNHDEDLNLAKHSPILFFDQNLLRLPETVVVHGSTDFFKPDACHFYDAMKMACANERGKGCHIIEVKGGHLDLWHDNEYIKDAVAALYSQPRQANTASADSSDDNTQVALGRELTDDTRFFQRKAMSSFDVTYDNHQPEVGVFELEL